MNLLWSQVNQDNTPFGFYSAPTIATMFIESMDTTFDTFADEFPSEILGIKRKKLIHTVGNVGKVQFIAAPNSPYTGVFEGTDNVLLRLSAASAPDTSKTSAAGATDNFKPGFGIKFLIDGQPSVNLVAMYSVNGQPSWNFFANDFSNHIPSASGVALTLVAKKFSTATPWVQTMGLESLASWTQKGQSRTPKYPFKLVFRPTSDVSHLFSDDYQGVYYTDQLQKIRVGSIIYDVYAEATPGATLQKIGSLKTTSPFVPSKWGDESLFFQHTRMDVDLLAHQDWVSSTPKFGCPFAFLH